MSDTVLKSSALTPPQVGADAERRKQIYILMMVCAVVIVLPTSVSVPVMKTMLGEIVVD